MPFARVFALFLILSAAGLAGTAVRASEAPSSLAKTVNDALIGAMRQSEALGYTGRYEALDPVLRRAFNFTYMARVSVGRHWRDLTDEEKRSLVEAFSRLSVATFASRFKGFSGEEFRIVGAKEQPKRAVLVLNDLIKSDGEAIAINYLMRKGRSSGKWRIVDVFLDAKFSELATKRSEFTAVVRREGLEGLLATIEAKIAGLAEAGESAATN